MQKNEMSKDVQTTTVLIVDDDAIALEEMQDIVDLEGWNAIIASDVDMALEVLEWYPYIGTVVTDVHFRNPSEDTSSGLQFISRAQARFHDRDINYIVLSGDRSAVEASEHVGSVEFIPKPLDADLLIEAIKKRAGTGSEQPICVKEARELLARVQDATQEIHDARVREQKGTP